MDANANSFTSMLLLIFAMAVFTQASRDFPIKEEDALSRETRDMHSAYPHEEDDDFVPQDGSPRGRARGIRLLPEMHDGDLPFQSAGSLLHGNPWKHKLLDVLHHRLLQRGRVQYSPPKKLHRTRRTVRDRRSPLREERHSVLKSNIKRSHLKRVGLFGEGRGNIAKRFWRGDLNQKKIKESNVLPGNISEETEPFEPKMLFGDIKNEAAIEEWILESLHIHKNITKVRKARHTGRDMFLNKIPQLPKNNNVSVSVSLHPHTEFRNNWENAMYAGNLENVKPSKSKLLSLMAKTSPHLGGASRHFDSPSVKRFAVLPLHFKDFRKLASHFARASNYNLKQQIKGKFYVTPFDMMLSRFVFNMRAFMKQFYRKKVAGLGITLKKNHKLIKGLRGIGRTQDSSRFMTEIDMKHKAKVSDNSVTVKPTIGIPSKKTPKTRNKRSLGCSADPGSLICGQNETSDSNIPVDLDDNGANETRDDDHLRLGNATAEKQRHSMGQNVTSFMNEEARKIMTEDVNILLTKLMELENLIARYNDIDTPFALNIILSEIVAAVADAKNRNCPPGLNSIKKGYVRHRGALTKAGPGQPGSFDIVTTNDSKHSAATLKDVKNNSSQLESELSNDAPQSLLPDAVSREFVIVGGIEESSSARTVQKQQGQIYTTAWQAVTEYLTPAEETMEQANAVGSEIKSEANELDLDLDREMSKLLSTLRHAIDTITQHMDEPNQLSRPANVMKEARVNTTSSVAGTATLVSGQHHPVNTFETVVNSTGTFEHVLRKSPFKSHPNLSSTTTVDRNIGEASNIAATNGGTQIRNQAVKPALTQTVKFDMGNVSKSLFIAQINTTVSLYSPQLSKDVPVIPESDKLVSAIIQEGKELVNRVENHAKMWYQPIIGLPYGKNYLNLMNLFTASFPDISKPMFNARKGHHALLSPPGVSVSRGIHRFGFSSSADREEPLVIPETDLYISPSALRSVSRLLNRVDALMIFLNRFLHPKGIYGRRIEDLGLQTQQMSENLPLASLPTRGGHPEIRKGGIRGFVATGNYLGYPYTSPVHHEQTSLRNVEHSFEKGGYSICCTSAPVSNGETQSPKQYRRRPVNNERRIPPRTTSMSKLPGIWHSHRYFPGQERGNVNTTRLGSNIGDTYNPIQETFQMESSVGEVPPNTNAIQETFQIENSVGEVPHKSRQESPQQHQGMDQLFSYDEKSDLEGKPSLQRGPNSVMAASDILNSRLVDGTMGFYPNGMPDITIREDPSVARENTGNVYDEFEGVESLFPASNGIMEQESLTLTRPSQRRRQIFGATENVKSRYAEPYMNGQDVGRWRVTE